MERHGEPITAYPLRTIDTGITYGSVFPELIPEIEEREAARFNGYSWSQWQGLVRGEKVSGVAYCRIRRAIDMNRDDAQEKYMKRKAKLGGKS